MKSWQNVLSVVIVYTAIAGCDLASQKSVTTEIMEPSLVTSDLEPLQSVTPAIEIATDPIEAQECAPPCWRNITPGVTSIAHARQIAESDFGSLLRCEEIENDDWSGLECKTVTLYWNLDTHLVNSIVLHPSRWVTLGELVQTYGEPDMVTILVGGVPEGQYTTFYVDYFDQGFSAIFHSPSYSLIVDTSMLADQFTYFKPDQLKKVTLESQSDVDVIVFTEWHGFGDYSEWAKKP